MDIKILEDPPRDGISLLVDPRVVSYIRTHIEFLHAFNCVINEVELALICYRCNKRIANLQTHCFTQVSDRVDSC